MKLLGRYQAFVRDVDDPLSIGRVRLEVPGALGNVLTDWAKPVLPIASSPGFGGNVVVKVADQVWAEFEDGNANKPVWGGGWWAQGQVPDLALGTPGDERDERGEDKAKRPFPLKESTKEEVDEPADPYAAVAGSITVFKLAPGFVVEFDATAGAERFHLYHPSGTFVEIHPNGTVVAKSGAHYSRFNGSKVDHVLGSRLEHVEKDAERYVEGSETTVVEGKSQVRANKGLTLEDSKGSTVVIDPSSGKITIQSVGDLDLVAGGTIRLDAVNVMILERIVLPTEDPI